MLLCVLVTGCQQKADPTKTGAVKPSASAVTSAELNKIGLAFQNHEVTLNKAPAKVEDLKPFLRDMDVEKSAYQKLAQGDVVLLWNTTTKGMKSGASNTVLAYEKSVPNSGGLVLMGSSEVKTMTASEFAGKLKGDGK